MHGVGNNAGATFRSPSIGLRPGSQGHTMFVEECHMQDLAPAPLSAASSSTRQTSTGSLRIDPLAASGVYSENLSSQWSSEMAFPGLATPGPTALATHW